MSGPEDDANAATLLGTPEVSETDATLASGQPARDSQVEIANNGLIAGAGVGRYQLVELLGAGAMGVVWSARDPQLDRLVAIKVVHPKLARSNEASGRLLREARAMAKLSHRAVVTVHDAGDVDGRLFLAMELVPGTTLGQMLRTRTRSDLADWRRWLALMVEAGRGLAAAHGAGVLHRDFKPDNVLVDRSGRVCVADFGLATLGDQPATISAIRRVTAPLDQRALKADQRSLKADLTTTGSVLGTPAYMSSQQLRGEPADARGDQFSFCVATWEALYGERPFFTEETGIAALHDLADAIEAGRIQAPPVSSQVPDAVADVLRRGMAANPDARWLGMDQLVDALERSVRKRNTSVISTRRPGRRWVVAAALVMVVGLSVGLFVALGRNDGPRSVAAIGTPKRMFGVALRARLAVSPDGKRTAFGGERIEVRDLHGPGYWSAPLAQNTDITHLELTADAVRYGSHKSRSIMRWRYASEAMPSIELDVRGDWYGTSMRGEVVYVSEPDNALRIVDGTREVTRWKTEGQIDMVQISPDRKRIAYVDGSRFVQHVFVRDVTTNRETKIGPFNGATAVTWRDDHSLLYAVGTSETPTIFSVDPAKPADSRKVFGLDSGWFGELLATNTTLYYIELGLSSRARIIENGVVRDFDASGVAAAVAWVSATEFLAWNRTSGRVERRASSGTPATTPIELAGEPANATLAEDLLIVTIRRTAGRVAIAYRMSDGAVVWRHDDLKTLAVRCAGDRAPPCFAVRNETGRDRIVMINPENGAFGPVVLEEAAGKLEDVAVNDDGTRLLVALTTGERVREIDREGHVLSSMPAEIPMSTARSVAYAPRGGYLMTGTFEGNVFRAGLVTPSGFTTLAQSQNDILSLIRPSPDGERVVVLSRLYAPALWQVALPSR